MLRRLAAVLALALLLSGCAEDPGRKVTTVEIFPLESAAPAEASETYALNTRSRRFHIPGCTWAARISDEHKREVIGPRSELIAEGYSPCGICNP